MPTLIRRSEHDFRPHPGRIDGFRLLTDIAPSRHGVQPRYLNFDFRTLPPGEYNAAYHFHRYAEELFFILSGEVTLRTPEGLTVLSEGDCVFFEADERGAHQLYNHADTPCVYLDIRTFIGHDVAEYPDSDKLILIPGGETFRRSEQHAYFEGETAVSEVWDTLRSPARDPE